MLRGLCLGFLRLVRYPSFGFFRPLFLTEENGMVLGIMKFRKEIPLNHGNICSIQHMQRSQAVSPTLVDFF
jgi:hypothetical protein